MILTKFQFRQLFTMAEKVAITTAAKSNAIIQVFLDDLMSAWEIDLSLSDTIDGLTFLTNEGILAPGRKEQILSETLPRPVDGYIRYKVSVPPEKDASQYCLAFASKDIFISDITKSGCTVLALPGTFNCNTATEVL